MEGFGSDEFIANVMVALETSSLTFETHTTGLSLLNSAKCYRPLQSDSTRDDQVKQGLVLLMAHGTGYHKEHWEPTIEHLFDLESEFTSTKTPPTPTIRECWAIDVQNHGEAAMLNEQITREKPEAWSIWDYADSFVTLRRDILGSNPSYRDNKFVLVAHSASATAAILATTFFPLPILQTQNIFHSLVLIEPAIAPTPAFVDSALHTPLYRAISLLMTNRKDTWASKEEARVWMEKKIPWGMWDARVLKAYVDFGLVDNAKGGVTLSCTRQTEALAYERGIRQSLPGLWQLNLLCSANAHVGDNEAGTRTASKTKENYKPIIPIHIVWGDIDDLFSREMKDRLEDLEQGRVFTSVTRVEDVGHMMIQTSPQATAKALWDIFSESTPDAVSFLGENSEDQGTQKPRNPRRGNLHSRL
ncbi:Alpha/beta hydrolase family-domain-containing protein [Lentinula lateritia]|uniref:Alpha/beta hydrolase family-domain-containing protein n=1 Tax=Lentinula lateritia TaxID=40482 RepID=A0ABQ8VVN4_9AGAR|nr:Alpha/beta hydrolase family-domain-containing protein [Lentinula lateritia]